MKYQFWKHSYVGNEEICVIVEVKNVKKRVYVGHEDVYGKFYSITKDLKCVYYGYTKDSLNEKFKEVISDKKRNQKIIELCFFIRDLKTQMKDYLIFVNGEELTNEKLKEIEISIRKELQRF